MNVIDFARPTGIMIHGRTYGNRDDIRARMEELRTLNLKLGASDGRVTERNALIQWLNDHTPAPAPKPVYYVLYRTAGGKKGRREFATRAGQLGFMSRTYHAVTAYN